ncbi:Tat pathway signal sequence domain protein [Streptomyces mirabilis]|jgi:chitin-binding protein|uniref:Tat pathway signal sequence domain protein n=1 Tax=Streptomyces mirabilis TaxID=68239 RepID=UPI003717A251
MSTTRRTLFGAALGGAAGAAVGIPATATAAHAASWQLKWSPSASGDKLGAFETIEDDRADSHPAGRPHIFATGDNWRFNMHTVDGDIGADSDAGGRWSCGSRPHREGRCTSSSRGARSAVTHIMQLTSSAAWGKRIPVLADRAFCFTADRPRGRTTSRGLTPAPQTSLPASPAVGPGRPGTQQKVAVWVLNVKSEESRTGVDTFLADRVRPKWGIYRSLGDTSGSLQDCYLLLTNLRGYQLV